MNGKAHIIGGAIAGPMAGMLQSSRTNRQTTFPEVCGWLGGGILGAMGPDLLEPANHPHHRKFAHSAAVLVGDLALLQSQTLTTWIEGLGAEAAKQREKAQQNPEGWLLHSIAAWLLDLLAGLLPGLLGGYASHLLLDCTTPFGIPIC